MHATIAPQWASFLTRHRDAHGPVVKCAEAAVARGVPLDHELKSMVLASDDLLVVAHTLATRRLSLQKVEKMVGGPVKLANSRRLGRLGLAAGRVNPFMECVQAIPHLVSPAVMQRAFLTTNDGTFTGFVRFSPTLLLQLDQVVLEDIDEAQ